ncbi:MAG: hypothetical protein MUF71_19475 [Candidatus Kapabacteria bacterium]|nr:hypothetical protein [Candidatus Kapabacteria bacterium]
MSGGIFSLFAQQIAQQTAQQSWVRALDNVFIERLLWIIYHFAVQFCGGSSLHFALRSSLLSIDSRPVPLSFQNPYPPLAALQWVFERRLGAAD